MRIVSSYVGRLCEEGKGMSVDLILNLICKIKIMVNKNIYLPLSFAFLSFYFIFFHGNNWSGIIIALVFALIGLFFAFKNIVLKEKNRQIKVFYTLIVAVALLFLGLSFFMWFWWYIYSSYENFYKKQIENQYFPFSHSISSPPGRIGRLRGRNARKEKMN